MSDVRIVPLCVGTAQRKHSGLVMGAAPDEVDITFTMFYVRADDLHIVVDTGVPPQNETAAHHFPMARTDEQDPVATLAALGVGADDVNVVVNTHLHWDHCANNHLFTNATIYAQRSELQYAIAPLPLHRHAYDEVELDHGRCLALPAFLRSKLTLIEGDFTLGRSVRVLHTPGHTPGSQSLLVYGNDTYLLPGDNIPLQSNLTGAQFTPNALHVDLESYYRSIQRSTAEADVILPGHDTRVFDRSEYR